MGNNNQSEEARKAEEAAKTAEEATKLEEARKAAEAEEARKAEEAVKAAEEVAKQGNLFDKKEFVYRFTEDCLFRGVYRYKGDEVTFPAETEVPHAERVK